MGLKVWAAPPFSSLCRWCRTYNFAYGLSKNGLKSKRCCLSQSVPTLHICMIILLMAGKDYGIIVQNNPINFIDPSGEFFILGSIVGAGVGAAAGGFGAVLGGSTDARSILSAAAVGAVSGFVGGGFGVTYAIGGIIGAFGGAAGAALMGGNPGAIAGAALGGAVGGIIGGLPGVGLPGLAYGTWIGSSWGTAYGLVGQEIYKLFLRESPAKQVCN